MPDGVSSVRLTVFRARRDVEITVPVSANTWTRTFSTRREPRAERRGLGLSLAIDAVWLDGNGQPVGPAEGR